VMEFESDHDSVEEPEVGPLFHTVSLRPRGLSLKPRDGARAAAARGYDRLLSNMQQGGGRKQWT